MALFYGERSGGIRTYLDAKAAHAPEGRDGWPLVFVGSGPAQDAVCRRARSLGIAHRVRFRPCAAHAAPVDQRAALRLRRSFACERRFAEELDRVTELVA